ncbi:SPOR domain-containing protein [Thiofilum flexile]|uniref:SPOR domain-containing protein n=1 Tax=Thiofilum flexile TaxID=125627 RepID=UPI00039A7DEE|nr:SPOR domain-containing protein [Thiofilum flexile]
MTKDFKEESTRTENSQYGISWMLGGVAVGLLAGIVMFNIMGGNITTNAAPPTDKAVNNTTAATSATASTKPASTPLTTAPAPATTPADNRLGFSYHAVLPVISMDESLAPIMLAEENPTATPAATTADKKVTSDKTTKASAEKAPAKSANSTDDAAASGNFMFQLGAYRSQAPALDMQAKARKYGMNTRIEQANVNGQVWYRIRIGPTKDQGVANRWRQSISAMGIDPIMIRM